MDEVVKKAAAALRERGFRGSGQNYRKDEPDLVCLINFQIGQRSLGDKFFVNLGAQPTFLTPDFGGALKSMNHGLCAWRSRVGAEWKRDLSGRELAAFLEALLAGQGEFFRSVGTLRTDLTTYSAGELVAKFKELSFCGNYELYLARAALALGYQELARTLATDGIANAPPRATGYTEALRALLPEP